MRNNREIMAVIASEALCLVATSLQADTYRWKDQGRQSALWRGYAGHWITFTRSLSPIRTPKIQ